MPAKVLVTPVIENISRNSFKRAVKMQAAYGFTAVTFACETLCERYKLDFKYGLNLSLKPLTFDAGDFDDIWPILRAEVPMCDDYTLMVHAYQMYCTALSIHQQGFRLEYYVPQPTYRKGGFSTDVELIGSYNLYGSLVAV